jgi:DNA-binding NarL/FixJ family response regulator
MLDLDAESLKRLRRLVAAAHAHTGGAVPPRDVLNVSEMLGLPGRLVIDLAAAEELGQPMLVLQVHRTAPVALRGLTPREGEVAALVATGLGNKQIATRLGISLPTVKDHVHRILVKTGLPSRAAVAAAVMGAPHPKMD